MNKEFASTSFENIDLGTPKPTSVPMEVIHVVVSTQNLLGDYSKAFIREAYRVNPLRAEQVALTCEELEDYCNYLLTQRVKSVAGDCSDFRKLKALYIPSWIQYNLSMIGEVTNRTMGLKMVPVMEEESQLTYNDALSISEKIGSFEDDLQIVQDAMPRSIEGNADVMSTAMIAGYIRAQRPVEHVAATYVTAFLGMKLREEIAMQVLYRVQYDDVAFIASALTTQKGLFH